MAQWLTRLSSDRLPLILVQSFVNWCIWEQAYPSFIQILTLTGIVERFTLTPSASTLDELERLSAHVGTITHEIRRDTGLLGLSTAEAAAFLITQIVQVASEEEWDPEDVAFYAAQVVGWAGFAQSGFTVVADKVTYENNAREQQELKLVELSHDLPSDKDL